MGHVLVVRNHWLKQWEVFAMHKEGSLVFGGFEFVFFEWMTSKIFREYDIYIYIRVIVGSCNGFAAVRC